MPISDAARARLPKSVQNELSRLEANVEYFKKMVEAGPENSDTFASGTEERDRPLGCGTRIYFRESGARSTVSSPYIEVSRQRDGTVVVRSSDALSITPQATNTIRVRAVSHGEG